MKRPPRNLCLAAAVWLAFSAVVARAQPAAEAPPAPPVELAQPIDPAVQAALALRATTPAEQLRSVLLLVELGATEHARPLLAQLSKVELSPSEMAALADKVGAAALMRLAGTESLAPEGPALAEALLEAAGRAARDPQRLSALILRLGDPSPPVRQAAVADLAEVGVDGAVACLAALADPQQTTLDASLLETLVAMGRTARGPLWGVLLKTNNDRLKAQVIEVIGRQQVEDIAAFLVGPAITSQAESGAAARRALVRLVGRVPTRAEAGKLVEREVRGYLGGNRSLPTDYAGQVELWQWDDATGVLAPHIYPAADASVFLAERLSRDLVSLGPENTSYRRLRLICLLEAAKLRTGMDQPLARGAGSAFSLAVQLGTSEVNRVLAEALEAEHLGAALGAVEVLGEIGTAALVDGQVGQPAALVRAAGHGDRRLRFAATGAIIKLNPERPYAGSSRVPENLAYFAATRGAERVVIGNPRIDAGQNLAAMLAQHDIEAEVAARGKQVIRAAASSADVEFVLLCMTIDRPGVREVLYQLRRDEHSTRLPIGLVAPAGSFEMARNLADRDALTVAFSRPHDEESVRAMIDRLGRLAGRSYISPEERQRQAVQSLSWFAALADGSHAFYGLDSRAGVVEAALYAPELTPYAARALAHVGRPSSQRALIALASQPLVALENRQTAAAAFRKNVEQHGLLMTRKEILRQYDLYNASESADRSTQEVLASILDTIEREFETPDAESDAP